MAAQTRSLVAFAHVADVEQRKEGLFGTIIFRERVSKGG